MRMNQGNDVTNSLLTAAAARLGISGSIMHTYVTGQRYPSLTTVRKIEEQFGWPVDAQVRLIPERGTVDLGYGTVLGEVLREHFPDLEPGFAGTYQRSTEPRHRPSRGGWTHAMVAKRLSAQPPSVTKWLLGIRYPDTRMLLRIERIFGWPAAEQIVLIPEEGFNDEWATAFRAVVDRHYPLKEPVTKITSEKV